MRRQFKADFHSHTSDDPIDRVAHSAEMLIDAARAAEVDILAITCHESNRHNAYVAEYARRRGMLLIPALEQCVEGKHIIILNPSPAHEAARTFDALREARRDESLVIAPHPYYPMPAALGRKLLKHRDLFDAVEHHSFHLAGFNPNRRAERVAKKHGLPVIGASDTHTLPYWRGTFTWVDAGVEPDEALPPVSAVIDAIRAGRVEVESQPLPWRYAANMIYFAARETLAANT